MLNEFNLSPLEKNSILSDAKSLTSQGNYEISVYTETSYQPGINSGTDSSWSDFTVYSAVVQEVDEFKSKRYDYGDNIEGDAILLLPYDTELPKDASKYRFKYNGSILETKSIQKETLLDETITHYYLVGKR